MQTSDRAKSHREDAALEPRPELLDLHARAGGRRADQDASAWQDDAELDARPMKLWQRVDGGPPAPPAAAPHNGVLHDGVPGSATPVNEQAPLADPHATARTGPQGAPELATAQPTAPVAVPSSTPAHATAPGTGPRGMGPQRIADHESPELGTAQGAPAEVAAPGEAAQSPASQGAVPAAAAPAHVGSSQASLWSSLGVQDVERTDEIYRTRPAASRDVAPAQTAISGVSASPAVGVDRPRDRDAGGADRPTATEQPVVWRAGPSAAASEVEDGAAAIEGTAQDPERGVAVIAAAPGDGGPADGLALQRAVAPSDGATVAPAANQRVEGADPAAQPLDPARAHRLEVTAAPHHQGRDHDPRDAHAGHGLDAGARDHGGAGHDPQGALGASPAAAAQGALGENVDELRAADPRGAARPEVATQTAAIEQLGHAALTPHAPHEQPAAHDHPQVELPASAKTLEEVNAAVDHRRQTIVAAGKAKESHTAARIHATAPHRSQAEHQRQLAHQQGHRSIEIQKHSQQQAHQHKLMSKQELRTKLTTTAAQKTQELVQKTQTQTTELEAQLQAKLAKLVQDQQQQNVRVTHQLDAKAAALEADIGRRKAAHDQQIATERAGLDKLDATETAKAKTTAKADAEAIKAAAQTQAGATLANANQRAGEVLAQGNSLAQAALATGETKAGQAIAAADSRAGQLDADHKDEAKTVRAEGQHRAQMARDAAKGRADQIHSKATADAATLRDTGKADHDKQIADGATRAAQAIQNGEDAAAKIHAQTAASIAAMQARSDAAVAAMQAEITAMKADIEAQRAQMNAKAQTALADAQAKAQTEQQQALAAMAKERDTTIKSIDDKVRADLAQIDASSDKDLARLGEQVERDISSINTSVQRAEQHIEKAVQRAEQHVETQVAKARAEIHTETAQLLGHLDHLAAQARHRIDQHDQHTRAQIHAAGEHGRAEVAKVAQQAQADLAAADGQLVAQTQQQGEQSRAAADKLASDSQQAMATSRADLDKDVNKAWVDDAVKKAHDKLDDKGLFNVVTDGEANDAMNLLNSLPPDQQGEAVKQLDQKSFDQLLGQVPSERRAEFKSLVDNTHDPERKLELWGEQHKSEVANDAKAEHDKTQDDGSWLFGRNAEQQRNHRLNERRDDIVKSTDHEVDDEMKFLLDKQAKGTLTEQDVLDLEARKEHEHKIEMKYNVNLTSKDGTRKDGTKIAWSEDELNQVESALAHMPESHVKDNTLLKEVRRSDQSTDEKDPNNPRIGGQHGDGVISIYDLGATGSYRHTGDPHELADPSLRGVDGQPLSRTGDPIRPIEETLNHEFGHDIHDQNPDAFKRYQAAAGWQQDVGDKQMAAAGISAADIAAIKAGSKTDVKGSDGKVYKPDPYNRNQVLAVDDGALPEPSTGATPNSATGGDTWDYARTNYKDNFAEHYTKAINAPEKLAKDLIDAPQTRVNNERTVRDAAQADLAAAQAKTPIDRREIDDQQARVDDANKRVDDAVRDQTAQKTQYDIVRNDIFHADQATDAAADRLAAKGVDPGKIAEFRAKAARAQTPQQVDLIASGY